MVDMGLKAKILVLFANAYDMKGENGEPVSGCSCHYLFWGESGETMIPQSEPDFNHSVGQQRAKVNLPYAMREKLQVVPAIYEGVFNMTTGSDGRPVMKLQDVSYYCDVSMVEKVVPGIIVPGMVPREDLELLPDVNGEPELPPDVNGEPELPPDAKEDQKQQPDLKTKK